MDFDEYQLAAMRTAPGGNDDSRVSMTALGLAGESGEVVDIIKKHLHHGHPMDRVKLMKELGDVLWYLAVMADCFDIDLSAVARANVEKLKARYPDGFSKEASRNRTDK